ncbi:MAG: hypothetical protein ABW321_11310 [Polyangiales bacterium]
MRIREWQALRRRWTWWVSAACGLLAAGLSVSELAACKNLIGIKDHEFTDDAPSGDLQVACQGYCDDVLQHCTAESVQAYRNNSEEDCMAVCTHLPIGEQSGATEGNSVSCRASYAAKANGAERDLMNCPAAAPGGGGPSANPACGTNCEAYCQLFGEVCNDGETPDKCVQQCGGLRDLGEFQAERDYTQANDTIQCRIAHVTAAAHSKVAASEASSEADRTAEKNLQTLHCGHAEIKPKRLANDGEPCDLPPNTPVRCEDYCKLVMVACVDFPVYASATECMNVCERGLLTEVDRTGLPKNTVDSSENTVTCRRWHAYFSLGTPEEHCSHAGPGGGGHCGIEPCDVYCSLLQRGCRDRFTSVYGDDAAMCSAECRDKLTGGQREQPYNIDAEETRTNTYQCRLHNLALVFGNMGMGNGMGMELCAKSFPADRCP